MSFIMKAKATFEEFLKKESLAKNSIESYLWTVDYFSKHYEKISSENLLAYKGYLLENFKPKTVNLRIQAMNKYLDIFSGSDGIRLRLDGGGGDHLPSGGGVLPVQTDGTFPRVCADQSEDTDIQRRPSVPGLRDD